MNKDKKYPRQTENENRRIIDSYDYLSNAASAQDCTGLIPSAPTETGDLEAYREIYPYLPPEVPGKDSRD